ncbi:Hypothetical Protein RradSPS_2803 (plasmid) [Rubrobacter radiotolerans]|uniref:Uncharacterized protein n=1 Tax=Rubrobacter radiotolerans TaxID=42256 RepID=A0A023X7C6_RUBRA|nr:hypothetical protein [Rubrobacter radiotolerans]AHY48086.1 Hypothetical Protein RradSPS_2803 [Rubrobacter radiotolerans]MDX5895361.1 hypothetical protein [Rubrobacter radiotolerans]SMC01702.1 hypothetical protein SAMN00767673_2910 [Rubrobacter radiotolerans DSM 5868]
MSRQRTERPDAKRSELSLLAGRAAALLGLGLALFGALGAEISMEVLGIIFGITGYSLGSRRLGAFVVVFSTVMLVLVLVVSRGYLPGIEPTYPGGLF